MGLGVTASTLRVLLSAHTRSEGRMKDRNSLVSREALDDHLASRALRDRAPGSPNEMRPARTTKARLTN